MNYTEKSIPLESLLLDPNNFRYQESDDFVYADESRFSEESVQMRAFSRLKQAEGLKALKASILANRYIPSERIVVRKFSESPEQYLVIEGNRRTAAAKWILDDHDAGVAIDHAVLASISELPCIVVESNGDQNVIFASLMGIRHVSGIKQWGGYQRAKLVVSMRDELGLSPNDTADRLGMTTHEVNRRYRAYKALEQFREHEEYGEYFKPALYPLFHEAVSLTPVKDWLCWSEDDARFENEEELTKFYDLITPTKFDDDAEEELELPPKVQTYSQVRELRVILKDDAAFANLIEERDAGLDEALAIAKQPEIARGWIKAVSACKRALEDMSIRSIKTMSPEDFDSLKELENLISERIQDVQGYEER